MDGILFLFSIIGVGLVMWWLVENDNRDPRAPTRGLFFAMRDVAASVIPAKPKPVRPAATDPLAAPAQKPATTASGRRPRRAFRPPTPRWPT